MDARTTIVIATRDRRHRILGTLATIRRSLPDVPIIVVDDASVDGTADAVRREHPDVTVLSNERSLGAAARNVGVLEATSPFVAFADDDSWYAEDAFELAAGVFAANPGVGLIAGNVTVEPGGRPDPTNRAMARSPLVDDRLPGPEVLGFIACGAIVRREAFLEVGGFDPRLHIGGEEELLALDLRTAGWRSVYVDAVSAHHQPEATDLRPGRRRRLARNRVWTAWLRRPLGVAVAVTARTAAAAVTDRDERAGLVAALRGIPGVLLDRRPVPPEVERAKRSVERSG